MPSIRVSLPAHLRLLAKLNGELTLDVTAPVTLRTVIDAIEAKYPMLAGTIRDHTTQQRRPLVRFYACSEDMSHEPLNTPLPAAIINGAEPLLIIGAIAGG